MTTTTAWRGGQNGKPGKPNLTYSINSDDARKKWLLTCEAFFRFLIFKRVFAGPDGGHGCAQRSIQDRDPRKIPAAFRPRTIGRKKDGQMERGVVFKKMADSFKTGV